MQTTESQRSWLARRWRALLPRSRDALARGHGLFTQPAALARLIAPLATGPALRHSAFMPGTIGDNVTAQEGWTSGMGDRSARAPLAHEDGASGTGDSASALLGAAEDGAQPAPEPEPRQWRTIWISDVHLGTPGCKAAYLLDFMKHHESEHLYLVGDIIDGWQLRKGWYWPQLHNDVVQKVLRKARKGTQVMLIPGNHDSFAREFAGLSFGDIEVREEAVHVTADGRKLWVIHGDQFDGVIQLAPWLARLGDSAYTMILKMNNALNLARARMGLPYWSLSQYLKHRVKDAVAFIDDYERALAAETRKRDYDGVVCGHIHKAEIREIDGLLYCNDGDWVESLSALVEDFDGSLQLITWDRLMASGEGAAAASGAQAGAADLAGAQAHDARQRGRRPVPEPAA